MSLDPKPELKPLNRLVGTWTTEATHIAMPGVVVRGTAVVEWLEGERFLIVRYRNDHPDFPDSISILGFTDADRVSGTAAPSGSKSQMTMHYYDSRGVFRTLDAAIDDGSWRLERLAPGFSQRFTGTFEDNFRTIAGLWQLCEDGAHWKDDLWITYRRS
jgi:hypothetical protein